MIYFLNSKSRAPFIEAKCVSDPDFLSSVGVNFKDPLLYEAFGNTVNYLGKMEGRRVIKTHLPFEFLPPQLLDTCKVVYVSRNPKDCAVSFYHHNLNVRSHGYVGSFEEFLQYFEEGFHVFGSYWHHLMSGWSHRQHPNLKFLWFEDMKKDQRAAIDDLCEFLDHPLTEDQKGRLCNHVKFENMKNNPNTNSSVANKDIPAEKQFIRKGQVGDWRNHFDKEKNQKWDKWIETNIKGTGLENIAHFRQSQ